MDWLEFSPFPDEAQLWIYGFEKTLIERDREIVGQALDRFLPEWVTHGQPVRGAYAVFADRFVLLAGHLADGISGCSIDSSVRNFKHLKEAHGLNALDRSLIFFRDSEGAVQAVSFHAFQTLVDSGAVTAGTPVFDTTIQTVAELRAGLFERPFEESWHARSFPLPVPR